MAKTKRNKSKKKSKKEQSKQQDVVRRLWLPAAAGLIIVAIAAGLWWGLSSRQNGGPIASTNASTTSGPSAVGTDSTSTSAKATSDAAATSTATNGGKTASMAAPTSAEIEAARKAGAVSYVLETSRGTVQLELRGDLVPLTVANFVKLAKSGFYDGLTFHRVEDWVVQGGDPRGDGTGGPGYTIRLETNPALLNRTGAIAMARSADPDSAGSQFYILKKDADWLDGDYAVFGRVTSGMDVVNKLQVGDKIISIRPASGS